MRVMHPMAVVVAVVEVDLSLPLSEVQLPRPVVSVLAVVVEDAEVRDPALRVAIPQLRRTLAGVVLTRPMPRVSLTRTVASREARDLSGNDCRSCLRYAEKDAVCMIRPPWRRSAMEMLMLWHFGRAPPGTGVVN